MHNRKKNDAGDEDENGAEQDEFVEDELEEKETRK